MRLLPFALSLMLSCEITAASVDTHDLKKIYELTESGQYQEALEKHLWFHEESRSSPGMGGVRLSYALSAWVQLGERYPAAMEALVRVRDKEQELLLSGQGDWGNFQDLAAINEALGEEPSTIELFLVLDQTFPEQAHFYYRIVEDRLFAQKKYDICAKYMGDPILKYEGLRYSREMDLSHARTYPEMDDPKLLQFTNDRYINRVVNLIKLLVAVDKREDALEIQKRALSYFPVESIQNAI